MQRVHILQLVFVYLYRVRDRQRVFYSVVFESLVAISLSPFPLSVFLSSLSFSFVLCLCFSHLLPLPSFFLLISLSSSLALPCPPLFLTLICFLSFSLSFHCSLSRSLAPLSVPFISSLLNALLLSSLNSVFSPLYSVCFFFQAPHTPFSNVVSKQSYFIANILSFHLVPPATKTAKSNLLLRFGYLRIPSCSLHKNDVLSKFKAWFVEIYITTKTSKCRQHPCWCGTVDKLVVHCVQYLFQTSSYLEHFFVFCCRCVQFVHTDLNGRSWRRAARVW